MPLTKLGVKPSGQKSGIPNGMTSDLGAEGWKLVLGVTLHSGGVWSSIAQSALNGVVRRGVAQGDHLER